MADPMPVLVRGTTYPSAKSCAAALGVSLATVYCAVSRRDPDSIGLGRGNRPPAARKGGLPRKPVIVAGQRFASVADLARAIGRNPKDVRSSLRRGEAAQRGIVLAVMKLVATRENEAMRARLKTNDGTLHDWDENDIDSTAA